MIPEHQKLSGAKCIDILRKCEVGILAMKGLDAFPYAVPVNYIFVNGRIYIHGKSSGTKIQNIRKDAHVTFCITEHAEMIPMEYTTRYSSVIVYGTVKMLDSAAEKHSAMVAIMHKLAPGIRTACTDALSHTDNPGLGILEITPIQITGKRSTL